MTLATATSALSRRLLKNSPAILTGIGAAGVVATALLTARASLRAVDEIRAVEGDWPGAEEVVTLSAREKVQLTWTHFIPPIVVGSATIACIISAQSINSRRNAALMSLYTLSDRALTEFREKTAELHGDSKVEKIQEEIARDRITSRDPSEELPTGDERLSYSYDSWTDRYFWSTRNEVDAAVNEVNAEINRNNYASLNMFYGLVGLGAIPLGDDFGWNMDHPMAVSYQYIPAKDGSPCMAVTFKSTPKQDYYSFR